MKNLTTPAAILVAAVLISAAIVLHGYQHGRYQMMNRAASSDTIYRLDTVTGTIEQTNSRKVPVF